MVFYRKLGRVSGNKLLVEHIVGLRNAFDIVRTRHPFIIDAVAILPDHLHCILSLPRRFKYNLAKIVRHNQKCAAYLCATH